MSAVAFFVPGAPAPKGSRTVGRRRDGSVFTRPASKGEHAWTALAHARLEPPYEVTLMFFFARPRRPSWGWPVIGDVDKCARAALDGLVRGRLLLDDRHVTRLIAEKRWACSPAEVGVLVAVETVVAVEDAA